MAKHVEAQRLCTFTEIVGNENIIAVTVGSDLMPVLLSLKQTPDYRKTTGSGASLAKKRANKPNAFSIHFMIDDEWRQVALEATPENYHLIQPIGRGNWLLVRGRAGSKDDANTSVYASDGQRLWSFHAGDGIEDVQVAEDGGVWVSYFDEGVYGSGGLGQSGLVRLDERGKVSFRYSDLYDRVPVIDDCYALNVCSAKETWLYYYSGFPLVKLENAELAQYWLQMPVSGSHAFAVHDGRVLFAASYYDRQSLFLVDLASLGCEELVPSDSGGHPIESFRAFGRRSTMFLSTGEALYSIDVRCLLAEDNSFSGTEE